MPDPAALPDHPYRPEHPDVTLVRHGETLWSRAGRHTGRTDVPLTDHGRVTAAALRERLVPDRFEVVLSSPLQRALDTCRLAGFGDRAKVLDDLLEWDYGLYEGLTSAQIREERPGWTVWQDGVPGGETIGEVCGRADRVIALLRQAGGSVVVFAHGHLLRILAARWCHLAPEAGQAPRLDPATISVLGWERGTPAILRWNS